MENHPQGGVEVDKAAIITAIIQYDKKLEAGEPLENGPLCEKLIERTVEAVEKLRKLQK